MRFGSVCSGIESASVAWHPLGWETAWVSEIEPFPSAVLAHRLPGVPNHGDMTLLPAMIEFGAVEAPDVLVGGTPCQAFSIAGMRQSLSDERGNLTLTYVEIADAIDAARAARGQQPAVIVWENVPGVLKTDDNAFGCFLAGLAGEDDALVAPGGRWAHAGIVVGPKRAVAWRVLDAQYFGVAQRRRRVFVVASARNGFDPGAVLFEHEGVRRDSAPRGEAGEKTEPPAGARADGDGLQEVVGTLCADTGRLIPCRAPLPFRKSRRAQNTEDYETWVPDQVANTLNTFDIGDIRSTDIVAQPVEEIGWRVRRLTVTECERLQGFADGWTAVQVKGRDAADGPRYKAIGNSMAVPCMAWLGRRINQQVKQQLA